MVESKNYIIAALVVGIVFGGVIGVFAGTDLLNNRPMEATETDLDGSSNDMAAVNFDYKIEEKIDFAAKPNSTEIQPPGLDLQLDNPDQIRIEKRLNDDKETAQWFTGRSGGPDHTIGLNTHAGSPDKLHQAFCTKIEHHGNDAYVCLGQGSQWGPLYNWWLGGNPESGWDKRGQSICHPKLDLCFNKGVDDHTFAVSDY
ncbi:MAG: hypothetical protein ABEK59_02045 [Halobacteria archaeon]